MVSQMWGVWPPRSPPEGGGPALSAGGLVWAPGTQGHQERTSRGRADMPSPSCVGPRPHPCAPSPRALWVTGGSGRTGALCPRTLLTLSPSGGATPASPPSPAMFLMPAWGPRTGRAGGNPHLGSGQAPALSPQASAPSPVGCSPHTSGRRAAGAQGPRGPDWARSQRCPPCR